MNRHPAGINSSKRRLSLAQGSCITRKIEPAPEGTERQLGERYRQDMPIDKAKETVGEVYQGCQNEGAGLDPGQRLGDAVCGKDRDTPYQEVISAQKAKDIGISI
jgi:hypothetical protein